MVFIFILMEEAKTLQRILHGYAKAGGPAASQALSLHQQTLQSGHLLLQALQLGKLATVVIQGTH